MDFFDGDKVLRNGKTGVVGRLTKENDMTNEKRYFSVLGDSVSTLEGYNPPECSVFYDRERKAEARIFAPSDTWWGQVLEGLSGELLVNDSWAGSTVFRHPACELPSYGCSDERTSCLDRDGILPDVIIVYLGTNDAGYGARLMPPDADDTVNPSCFTTAYRLMLRKLKRKYPKSEIWCVSPSTGNSDGAERRRLSQKAYCDAIAQCAREAGCLYMDLYNTCKPYDTIDGLHPSAEGMRTIAQAILSEYNGKK